ncbi:glycosyl hydrolase family 28-related protein [Cellulomonas composti]|uniref:glycosyl hydrolase family 28-related protein n=1 Tax=Cellulomonas composti TaxID=266130 RepID=UPI001FEA89D5|nr:glycosyl hydrolase family 28-related protein [Cellulomonas composti]
MPRSLSSPRFARLAGVVAMALVAGATAVPAAVATTSPPPGVETRAAIDPSLSTNRGARLGLVEQEAENAVTDGELIGPSRDAYTLPAEASGRAAVKLDAAGESVQFTLTKPANALTVRYALPDSATGGGLSGKLRVSSGSAVDKLVGVTSKYSWLYNQYPFTNDPNADLLHPDWWLAECGCVPSEQEPVYQPDKPFRPFHFYAEQRVLLGTQLPAGATVSISLPAGTTLPWAVVDVVDFQQVAAPLKAPRVRVHAVAMGADPTGKKDSTAAIEAAIAKAKQRGVPVWVPAGTYKISRHIVVDDVTIRGAGSWYTIFTGKQVTLSTPAPDGSTHTGVGFYGRSAEDGGSSNVRLADFAIVGDVSERIDDDQVNGIGGALSDSVVNKVYIQRTKVGVWLDGPMDNFRLLNSVVVDQMADGLNFHTGVTSSLAKNNLFRNTGDDALAMWADGVTNADNTFERNTVQTPTLANGIAIYGGTDITVVGNLVADPIREGSALHLGSRFGAQPFAGDISLRNNTTVRAGGLELNWNIGMGALWVFSLERSIDANVLVQGDHYLDSTYNAIMLVTDWSQKDNLRQENLTFKNIKVDGVGTSVLSARTAGSATFVNVDARNVGAYGVNNCGAFNWDWVNGSEFTAIDGGGNDGTSATPWGDGPANWLTRYTPNTISCNDRPTVVAPPAPSPWAQP